MPVLFFTQLMGLAFGKEPDELGIGVELVSSREALANIGVEVPVLAWGLGIDRMAMMQLALDDMRELFSSDIDKARQRRRSL